MKLNDELMFYEFYVLCFLSFMSCYVMLCWRRKSILFALYVKELTINSCTLRVELDSSLVICFLMY